MTAQAAHGDFALLEPLGLHGNRVYRRRIADGRVVAVRLWRGDEPVGIDWVEQIRSAIRVRHPALAAVESCRRLSDGAICTVSEYVHGTTLARWMRQHSVPELDHAIDVACRLCLGLNAALRAGVAHNAIHPGNVVVLEPDFRLKLLDLGVPAGMRVWPLPLTAAHFAAPELLASKERREPDARMTVYSCGSLLHFLCAGKPPYAASNLEQLQAAHASATLSLDLTLPMAVRQVIERALSVDPQARFADPGELASALRACANPAKRKLPPPPPPARIDRTLGLRQQRAPQGPVLMLPARAALDALAASDSSTPSQSRAPARLVSKRRSSTQCLNTWRQLRRTVASEQRFWLGVVAATAASFALGFTLSSRAETRLLSAEDIAHCARREARPASIPSYLDTQTAAVSQQPAAPAAQLTHKARTSRIPKAPPQRVNAAEELDKSAPEDQLVAEDLTLSNTQATRSVQRTKLAIAQDHLDHLLTLMPIPVEPDAPSGTLRVTSLSVQGSLTASAIRRAIERIEPGLTTCYRSQASSRSAPLHISVVLDEVGRVRAPIIEDCDSPSLQACIMQSTRKLTSHPPDTGVVKARWTLSYRE